MVSLRVNVISLGGQVESQRFALQCKIRHENIIIIRFQPDREIHTFCMSPAIRAGLGVKASSFDCPFVIVSKLSSPRASDRHLLYFRVFGYGL